MSVLWLASFCICFTFFVKQSSACIASENSKFSVGQVKFQPGNKNYVRCISPFLEINCRDTYCNDGESKRPQLQNFVSLAECLDYKAFSMCYNPTHFICTPDVPGCNKTYQVQWPNEFVYYDNEETCHAAVPDAVGMWIRCNNRGTPVCRYEDCHDGEQFLNTGPGLYSDADSCMASLYWARPCYAARSQETSPPQNYFYYEQIAVFDTSEGTCDPGDLLLTESYFKGVSKDDAAMAAFAYYSSKLQLKHRRCQVGSEPVCRPAMPPHLNEENHFCGRGELLFTETNREEWANWDACMTERFWGLVCYRPTRVQPFYEIYVNVTNKPICGSGDLSLGQVSADSYVRLEAKANNLYTRSLNLTHHRCGLPQADWTFLPICRPKLLTDNACGPNEDELLKTGVNRWNTYGDCLEQRFWGIGCYTANKVEEPYFQYHTVWDTPTGTFCPINSALLGPMNSSFSAEDLNAKLSIFYTPSTQLTHYRCDVDGVPVCRPDVDQVSVDFCGQNEILVGRTDVTAWRSLAACTAQRYWRLGCYHAFNISSDDKSFYEIYAVDALNGGCREGDLPLRFYAATHIDELPTVNQMNNDYIKSTKNHVRCEVWDEAQNKIIPVCRPNYGTTTGCPLYEPRLTFTAVNTWNGLISCNAMRYWGIGCYFPNQNQEDDFFEHKVIWDNHLGHGCPLNSRRTTPNANYSSNPIELGSYIAPFYALKTQLTHWRCSVEVEPGDVRPVCRPDINGGSLDGCAVDEKRIDRTTTTSWRTLEACRAQLYWTILCYHPIATSPYYELDRIVMDKPGVKCKNNDLFLGIFHDTQLTSEDFLTVEAAQEFYDKLFITHYRCHNPLAPEPICRPEFDNGAASSGDHCPPGEVKLTSTPAKVWNTIGQCNNQRFWGIGCYLPNHDAEPFYEFLTIEDTIGGFQCPPNSVRIGGLLFDSERTSLQQRVSDLYYASLKLDHFRCDVDKVPVCRPRVSNGFEFCGEHEDRIMQTSVLQWHSLEQCLSQRFWAIGCYTTDPNPPYYRIYNVSVNNALHCAETDVQLVMKGAPTQEEANAFVRNWYSLRTRPLPHERCQGTAHFQPVCRPRYPLLNFCPEDEERILQFNTGGYNSLDACEESLYWGFGCYVAKPEDPYYDIVIYRDMTSSDTVTCPQMSSYKLHPNFIQGVNQASVNNSVYALYNTSVQMDHQRCLTKADKVVCRPILDNGAGDGCALHEVKLMNTPKNLWDTLGQCEDQKYWVRVCYIPDTPYSDFYNIRFCYEHEGQQQDCAKCGADEIQIGFVSRSEMNFTQNDAESFYTPSTPITHILCADSQDQPFCRPNSTCAPGEVRIGTHSWSNLGKCLEERWTGLACYKPQEAEPYYQVYNVTKPAGSCAEGDLLLASFTAPESDQAAQKAADYYTRTTLITHNRCDFNGIPVCRPRYPQISGCPDDDLRLLNTGVGGYNSLDSCQQQLHWAFGCYMATNDAPDYFNISVVRDSSSSSQAICPPNAIKITNFMHDADFSVLTKRIYDAYNLSLQFRHIRCDVGSDAVCRPYLDAPGTPEVNDGDACAHNELRITSSPTIQWTTFASCNSQRYWARACYEATYIDPFYDFNVYNDFDRASCPEGEAEVGIASSPTLPVPLADAVNAQYPTKAITHWRCNRFGDAFCRPEKCFPDETRLDNEGTEISYESLNDCLAKRYWAKVCYAAFDYVDVNTSLDYELQAAYDSDLPPLNDCALTNAWPLGTWLSSDDYDINATAIYDSLTAMTHYRCKGSFFPFCRPLQCAPTETMLLSTPVTQWPNLAACQAVQYWARGCYVPLTTESTFFPPYSIIIREDTNSSSCISPEIELTFQSYDPDTPLTVFVVKSAYQTGKVNHARCFTGGKPYCRPFNGETPSCPPDETLINSQVYSSLDECLAQTIVCVNNMLTTNFTCVPDSQPCLYTSAVVVGGVNATSSIAACFAAAETMAPPGYDRCEDSSADYVCYEAGKNCPAAYPNKVLWNVTLNQCNNNDTRYQLCIDYGIQVNPFEGGQAWQCRQNSDYQCSTGEIRAATNFTTAEACYNYRSFASWHKCEVDASSAPLDGTVTCRPDAFGVMCNTVIPETLGGGPYTTVSECLDGTWCVCTDEVALTSDCYQYDHDLSACNCPTDKARTNPATLGLFYFTYDACNATRPY